MSIGFHEVARFIETQIPVGMAMKVSGHLIDDLPDNPLTGEPALHRLMSNLIGSGWGAWRVTRHAQQHVYTFEHREPNPNNRVFYDWDRRPAKWDDSGWLSEDLL